MSSTATLMEDSMSSTTLSALSDSITPSEPSVRSESSRASEPPEESNFSVILDFGESISSEQLSAMDEVDKLVQDQTGKLATPNHDYPDDEDLSPERIDEILIRAAARLREQRNLLQRISPAHKCLPKVDSGSLPTPYMRSTKGIVRLEPKSLVSEEQRRLANNPRSVEDPISLQVRAKSKASAGLSSHFGLPRTNLSPELKRDMQLLNMRAVLDPKRMYKKQGHFRIPEYSQVGTIVEGPTDFFSARISKKDRKRTFVEETLASEANNRRFKRKYEELQTKKKSGRKTFYKGLMEKRTPKRAG